MAIRLAGILMCLATGLASASATGQAGEAPATAPATASATASATAPATARDPALDARVAYWTSEYAGAELGSCEPPRVPALSRTNGEIRTLGRAINAWQRCQAALVERLRVPAALEERVEPAVLAAMRPEEREAARRHVEAVQARRLQEVEAEGAAATKWHRDWLAATTDYVAAENAGQKAGRQPASRSKESERR